MLTVVFCRSFKAMVGAFYHLREGSDSVERVQQSDDYLRREKLTGTSTAEALGSPPTVCG